MTGPQTAEGWVLKLGRDRPELKPSELHVLLTLAARHNRDHQVAHPKVELLSRETHLSVRQVLRILNGLADPERQGGAVLHISFGPLPVESKSGNPIYGNAYRFVGFDPIPEQARPRRRDVVDTRPSRSDNLSHTPSDTMSHDRCDTGGGSDVTSGGGPCDTGDADHVTSANSPLYPVKNPASKRSEKRLDERNPVVNPGRARAPEVPSGTERTCDHCGDELPSSWPAAIRTCTSCARSRNGAARASPSPASGHEPAASDHRVPAGGTARERPP